MDLRVGKNLPQDEEGDMLSDKGCGNTSDQSNQVGNYDSWQPAVVITEKKENCGEYSVHSDLKSEDPPEPSEEEHARHSTQEEDGLQAQN